ncbi:RNA polymerase sigma factor [Aequorivita antarctica]|uniref:Sigma-70 family RNA polymerase sigma factor n=1 Tax=Aequorivita antarctica TaxID=153266 RepID=A0A5C6Z616_9FLAO|nr:sigma-70 family RNA polymerase sigma factor [Aequorivita antarctica]TXD74976.1 sigma-70 family RNA polymerase sigma factor [Aequorivita antarctica]SRX72295.1 putative RNA polymerase sigma factor FecI [Aequorivita antarctica]
MPKKLDNNICEEITFARIYNKYAKDLHDFLYYKFGEQFNPSDKAQDAFMKLWDNCKKVPVDKAKSYLFTIANNMMLNEVKHQKVVLKHQKIKPEHYTNESPEFILEKEQFLELYQKALEKLSEEQRVAFMMNKAEGKKHSEIAEMLGVTQKVVEYRIYTAFSFLKNELEGFKIK